MPYWSRRLSADMGIDQDDFVKAFVLALSDDRVARKLQETICGQLSQEVGELRDIVKARDVKVNPHIMICFLICYVMFIFLIFFILILPVNFFFFFFFFPFFLFFSSSSSF